MKRAMLACSRRSTLVGASAPTWVSIVERCAGAVGAGAAEALAAGWSGQDQARHASTVAACIQSSSQRVASVGRSEVGAVSAGDADGPGIAAAKALTSISAIPFSGEDPRRTPRTDTAMPSRRDLA
ncbi:MAG: hypothetical protein AB7O88_14285 [Reyranellaceae bacterium]